jgi:hypothetical protein
MATCEKPDAMGVSRVVEIDTIGGPKFGLQLQLSTVAKYDETFDHREDVSSSAQPRSVTTPGYVAATHHRRSMYMYVPAQGRGTQTHTHKRGL